MISSDRAASNDGGGEEFGAKAGAGGEVDEACFANVDWLARDDLVEAQERVMGALEGEEVVQCEGERKEDRGAAWSSSAGPT